MQVETFDSYKFNSLASIYLIILLTRINFIVDTAKPITPGSSRQMCAKIQAMLFSGKHHPHQIASNLTYVSRSYTQNFLAYSPIDDLLIFLEPKYQLHVYTAQDAHLVGHIPATNVVYASSCLSIMTGDRYDLCFIYESRMKTNIISIRVCEVRFNLTKLQFEDKKCIDSTIRSDRANIRINGFAVKRDHFGTKRSLLFVSTTFGLIYTIFDMRTYVNIRKPIILNDTLTEGSAVLTSAGVVYYANKEEHTIHEIHVTKDFRIRYGKIIKSNAIKSPFGLITDECNHLFIATKTMVLVMYMQSYTTIRSIFLRPSDFPITMERINSSSYIYATVKKQSGKIPAKWLFNIFSFADPSLATTTTPRSVVRMNRTLHWNMIKTNRTAKPMLNTPMSLTTVTTYQTSELTSTNNTMKEETIPTSDTISYTLNFSTEHLSSTFPVDNFQNDTVDESVAYENTSLLDEIHSTTESRSDQDYLSEKDETTRGNSEPVMYDDSVTIDSHSKTDSPFDEDPFSQINLTQSLQSTAYIADSTVTNTFLTSDTIANETESSTQTVSQTSITFMNDISLPTDTLTSLLPTTIQTTTVNEDRQTENNQRTSRSSIEETTTVLSLPTEMSTQHYPSSTSLSSSIETILLTNPFEMTILSSETPSTTDHTNLPLQSVSGSDFLSSMKFTQEVTTEESYSNVDTIITTQVWSISSDENTRQPTDIHDINTTILSSLENTDNNSMDETSEASSSNHHIQVDSTSTIPSITHSLNTDRIDDFDHTYQTTTYLPMVASDSVDNDLDDKIIHKDSLSISIENSDFVNLHSPLLSFMSSTPVMSSHHFHAPALSSTISTQLNSFLSSKQFLELETTEIVLTTTQPPSVSTLQTSTASATTVITEQSSRSTFSKESSSSLMTSYPMVTSIVSSQMTTTTDNLITLPTSNRIFETSSVSTMITESRTTDYETYMTPLITTSTSLDSTTIIQTTNEPSTLLPSTIATDQMTSSTTDSITSETTFIPSTFSTTITTIYTEEYTSNLISTESLQKSSTILSTLLTDHFSEEYSLTSTEASISTNDQELEEYSSTPSSSEVSSTFSSSTNDQYFDDSSSTQLWSEESPPFSSVVTDEYSEVYTSTQSYTDETSTIFSDISNSESDYSTLAITSASSQSDHSTIVSHKTDTSTMTSPNVEITTQRTTTMETSTVLLTTIDEKDLITSPFTTWYSKLNPLRDQQITTSKPSLARNLSRTLLSNELLHQLFTNTSNSSSQRLISFDLSDLPASSWNLSLQTNESIVLDIVLPDSSNSNATTNLSITKIEADRFTTNIVGSPINLHVDQIHTKQFTLAMNLTNNLTNQVSSDVVIGHVKSEQFQMDITKSDNMNIHVTQVDSETAELFFDSKFCTNDTNLQINLNLTKNGTIRYGDRPPIRIGPVFTRVHMLKQSCDLNQPFTVFFDICQGQNPCLNGGTCQSQTPDYDDPSYVPKESEISYKCICPMYVFGEQCEQSQYPLGYCINEGTLTYIIDFNNRSIEKCLCARGFEGEHCEENMDDCVGVRCSNHGICQDEINSYTCSCFDGYYGSQCEQRNVETVLLQVASKSFATVAIMLIVGIASLVVISDIHTYLTRKKQIIRRKVSRVPRTSSELYESSVLLLAFGDAPIEMNEIPNVRGRRRKRPPPASGKKRPVKKKRQTSDQRQTKKKYKKTPPKTSSKNSTITNPAYETIL